eukprot:scaffold1484_cov241-Pinguiococcus_pyrenoidosus.AAC.32
MDRSRSVSAMVLRHERGAFLFDCGEGGDPSVDAGGAAEAVQDLPHIPDASAWGSCLWSPWNAVSARCREEGLSGEPGRNRRLILRQGRQASSRGDLWPRRHPAVLARGHAVHHVSGRQREGRHAQAILVGLTRNAALDYCELQSARARRHSGPRARPGACAVERSRGR